MAKPQINNAGSWAAGVGAFLVAAAIVGLYTEVSGMGKAIAKLETKVDILMERTADTRDQF